MSPELIAVASGRRHDPDNDEVDEEADMNESDGAYGPKTGPDTGPDTTV